MSNKYLGVRSVGLAAVVVLLLAAAGCVFSGRSETERVLAEMDEASGHDTQPTSA